MQKVTVLCFDKIKELHFRSGCAEFQKRIGAFFDLSVKELVPKRLSQNPSEEEIKRALDLEGKMLFDALPKNAFVVALSPQGKQMTSKELSEVFKSASLGVKSHMVFLIGSSFGLSSEVTKRADICLSFSKMTFPHELFRVMLFEQIYRCGNIIKGTKYDK